MLELYVDDLVKFTCTTVGDEFKPMECQSTGKGYIDQSRELDLFKLFPDNDIILCEIVIFNSVGMTKDFKFVIKKIFRDCKLTFKQKPGFILHSNATKDTDNTFNTALETDATVAIIDDKLVITAIGVNDYIIDWGATARFSMLRFGE